MASIKKIVAISHPSDAHLAFVEKHLPEPFILLDQSAIIDGKSLSVDMSSADGTRVFWDGNEIRDVSGVWYRRPEHIKAEKLPVAQELRSYSLSALKEFGMLMRALFPDATWISEVHNIHRAENKVLQLSLARKIGFNVPETVFTSDESAARHFLETHKSVVTKPIQAEFFEQEGELYNFYTKKIGRDADLTGLNLAPAIFQQAIDVKLELRITVVGNQVFAASIRDKLQEEESGVRDWRLGIYKGDLEIAAYELPTEIAAKCIKLVSELGLNFGAIDMIVDHDDKYWFLENNPNGQWAFVEEATNQPIGKAIADLLMGEASD